MTEDAIVVSNLTKTFKMISNNETSGKLKRLINPKKIFLTAVDNVSFKVKKGETLGILGSNGSGKTTLLRLITGIYSPDSGSVRLNGKLAPILHLGTGFHKELDAEENIILSGLLFGISKKDMQSRIPKIIEFAELEKFRNMKLKHYSSGMRSRLAFSTALEVDPDILLIDEVLSVGDMAFRKKSYEAFNSFMEKGKTILYVSHNLDKMPELCDEAVLLDHGKLILKDKPEIVIQKYKDLAQNRSKPK